MEQQWAVHPFVCDMKTALSVTRIHLIVLVLLAGSQALGQDLSQTDRAYLASRVYASLLGNFAHWQDAQGVDVEAAYRSYLEKALVSPDRTSFSRASMEFLAAFHNGHTMFMDRALNIQAGSVPFIARFLGGKWVITESRIAELKPGDVIEAIEDQTFEDFYQERRRFISASTEPWARYALFAEVPGFAPYAHLMPQQFVLRVEGGRQVKIDRRAASASPGLATQGRWLEPGKAAYIRIPSFMSPEFEKRALELLNEFREAELLIVDVRGNIGGSTPGQLTAALMDRPYRWWTESTPVLLPYFRYRASQGGWEYQPFDRPEFLWRSGARQPSKEAAFKGKLALLIDAGCHSACEDFTLPFKDNHRALVVGETTAGSTGQPYMLDLGHEMMLMVGAKRAMFPDGAQFEGVGIKPDVQITPTVDDLRQGRDPVLEAALKSTPRQ
jgi:carboxyl-terminal processing protease